LTSTYYTAFIKFAHFCRETNVADPELYIDLMSKSNISPTLWPKEHFYNEYIEYLEKKTDPYKQLEMTVETLGDVAIKLNVDMSTVFESMRYGEVLTLLTQRKLSPWFLFCSAKFKAWMAKLDEHERRNLMKQIGAGYWALMLEKRPDVVKDARVIAQEVGL
jgi:hypothetical protein